MQRRFSGICGSDEKDHILKDGVRVLEQSQIVFTNEQTAELLECPADITPLKPEELAGKTLYTLISPGTELNMYLGNYSKRGLNWGKFPCYPGYAAVFQVEQVGCDIDDIKLGDFVYCMGKHKSFQRIARSESIVAPKGIDPKLVPFCRIMNVTMSSLTDTLSRPPAKILVTGLGVVGLLGAQIFALCGYDVTAVDPLEQRRACAQHIGIKKVMAQLPLNDAEYVGKVSMLLECASVEQTVLDGCKLVKKGGEIIMVGTQMVRSSEIYAQELLYQVFRNNVIIRGGSEWRIPLHETDYRQNSCFMNMKTALDWLAEGSVRVDGLYGTVSPCNPQETYQKVMKKEMDKLCTLFDWNAI